MDATADVDKFPRCQRGTGGPVFTGKVFYESARTNGASLRSIPQPESQLFGPLSPMRKGPATIALQERVGYEKCIPRVA